jgi:predicted amidophosphoribosyltransferase
MNLIDYDIWEYDLSNEYKYCRNCNSEGYFIQSSCCGADIDTDILICHACKEHSDLEECEDCNGVGAEELTDEEILELEYNDACNRADDFIKDQKESR